MIIFSKKHFASKAKLFSFFINIAIYLRAFLAILMRFITYIKLPLIDIVFMLSSLLVFNAIKPLLGFPNQIEFFDNYGILNVMAVIFSFLAGLAISGAYSKNVSIKKTVIGLILGCIIFVGVNHFFPDTSSFSTKYIISILAGVLLFIPFSRIFLNYFNHLRIKKNKHNTSILVGNVSFIQKMKEKLKNNNIITVKPDNDLQNDDVKNYAGKLYQLPDLIEIYNANEVFINSNEITYKGIIDLMDKTKSNYVDFKFIHNNDLLISSQKTGKI